MAAVDSDKVLFTANYCHVDLLLAVQISRPTYCTFGTAEQSVQVDCQLY